MGEPHPHRRERMLVAAAFAAVVVIFGVNFVALRISNRELAPFWGGALRFLGAATVLGALVAAARLPLPRGRALVGAAVYGALAFGLNFAFTYWGMLHVGAGMASVLFATIPMTTLFLAYAVGVERLGWRTLAAATVAVTGIAIVFWDQLAAAVPLGSLLAVFAGALCGAGSGVAVKRFPAAHPVSTNLVGMVVGAAVLLVASLAAGETHPLPAAADTWLAVGWLVAASAVGFVLMVWVLSKWSASATSYTSVLAPLVTVAVAAPLAGEAVSATFLLGGAVVLAAVALGISGAFATPASAPSPDAQES